MPAPEKAVEIKVALAAFLAFLTALWGWLGWTVLVWIACFLLDYLSGTAAACKNGTWSSDIAREGLWHKFGEIVAVLGTSLCDIAVKNVLENAGLNLGFDIGPIITPIVLFWYIVTELGSIVENAGKMGAPVPSWLKKQLAQYKETIDAQQGEKRPEMPENETGAESGEKDA